MALTVEQGKEIRQTQTSSAIDCLRSHWPEYLMEVAEVGIYLFFTCVFASILLSPATPVRPLADSDVERRALMGLAVGATVVAIVTSPWGKQSGGHFNPALTLAFYRLGKMSLPDAIFYIFAQFWGAIIGVCIARYLLPSTVSGLAVRYAVTTPGARGSTFAFVGELVISAVLMFTVLVTTNSERFSSYTPYVVGLLYTSFIIVEAPLSGMSMNPARSFAPALHANHWHALWLYFLAPSLGMLIAAEVFMRARGGVPPYCAKLHHANNKRCIFYHGAAPSSASRFQ